MIINFLFQVLICWTALLLMYKYFANQLQIWLANGQNCDTEQNFPCIAFFI